MNNHPSHYRSFLKFEECIEDLEQLYGLLEEVLEMPVVINSEADIDRNKVLRSRIMETIYEND